MKAILDWARAEGREKNPLELQDFTGSAQLSDEQVNQKLAESKEREKPETSKPPTRCAPN